MSNEESKMRNEVEYLGKCLLFGRRKGREFEFGVIGHHALESNTDTFNDSQEDSTHNGRVASRLDTTTDGQGATSEETSTDRVPGIFLFANALDSAVVLGAVSNGRAVKGHRNILC